MSANYISEIISLTRDAKKAWNGDKLSAVFTVGDATKVIEKLAKVDNSWGGAARDVIDVFTKSTQNSKSLRDLSGVVSLARKADEISMVNSVIQATKSNSPTRKFVEEALGWTVKFATNTFMLNNVPKFIKNNTGLNSIATKITDFSKNNKGFGQVPNIISGIAFSVTDIYIPKYARKLGGWVCDKLGVEPYKETSSKKC